MPVLAVNAHVGTGRATSSAARKIPALPARMTSRRLNFLWPIMKFSFQVLKIFNFKIGFRYLLSKYVPALKD
jgi:hypothetical protein